MFTDFNVSIFEDLDFFFEFDKALILRERERDGFIGLWKLRDETHVLGVVK